MGFLQVALETAVETGKMIKVRQGSSVIITEKSSPYDLVTEVDQEAEKMIRSRLTQAFPEHQILGEEGVYQGQVVSLENAEYVWLVDPIDGTNNFIKGLPGYTVSIGLAYRGELIIGVVYDPTTTELFWAEKGKGAFLHLKQLQVSTLSKLQECTVATGIPSDIHQHRAQVLRQLQKLGPLCQNVRVLGSAALHLVYVAAGRLDAFWEPGLNIWDTAAGTLIVQEAGGHVTSASGAPFDLATKGVVASNGYLHESLLGLLVE